MKLSAITEDGDEYGGLEDADKFQAPRHPFHGSVPLPDADDELDIAVMYYTPCDAPPTDKHLAEAERLLQTKVTKSDIDEDPFSSWDEDFRFGYVWLKLADKRPNGTRFVGVENDIVIRVEPPWWGYPKSEEDEEVIDEQDDEYAGLEDADKFNNRYHQGPCDHCGRIFHIRGPEHIWECDNDACDRKTCGECMDKNGWSYDYATDTGTIVYCEFCAGSQGQ